MTTSEHPAVAQHAAARLAAGLVLAELGRLPAFDSGDAASVLDRVLSRSTLWQAATDLEGLGSGGAAVGRVVPEWRDPGAELTDRTADDYADLWAARCPPPVDPTVERFVRVRVRSVDDARTWRAAERVDEMAVVATLSKRARRLRWRWPMRVAVVDGPSAAEWLDVLTSSPHHGGVFDAEIFDGDADASYEIALVDVDRLDSIDQTAAARLHEVACVIVAGPAADADALGRVIDLADPAVAIAVPEHPGVWWVEFYSGLTHDLPIDVATAMAHPQAMIAGPEIGLDITAVAHWFAAVAPDVPDFAAALPELPHWDFLHERWGASNISQRSRTVRAGGIDPEFVVDLAPAEAAAPPPPPPPRAEVAAPPGVEPTRQRHLIAELWDGSNEVRTVLPPASAIQLAVSIAVPKAGQIAAETPFATPDAPGPAATLDVVVTSGVWSETKTQSISLPIEHPERPSTPAVFEFTTPESGSVVEFDIVVTYQGKPLQAATLTASVRNVAVPSDRPSLLTYTLTGPDEPTATASPVDATLDARGAELRALSGSGAALLITDVQDMLDTFEDMISRVLGVVDAPLSLDDDRARQLLIDLARKGSEFRTLLSDFALDGASAINLLVSSSSRVLPLELVYDGKPPKAGAKLCKHVGRPPPPGSRCTKTSTRRVCPYAFWGLHRVVSRTVASTGARTAPVALSLAPSPVLYAATKIADDGVAAGEVAPSDLVERTASELFAGAVARVTSWTKWRQAVSGQHPQVLVVLGHTQIERGEAQLHIGTKSVLAQPDIDESVVRADDTPSPLVVLMACASAQVGDAFGTLPGVFAAKGAGAVVGTLSKINGPQGAAAANSVLAALESSRGGSLGTALAAARRSLVEQGLVLGLILVSHGEIDTIVST